MWSRSGRGIAVPRAAGDGPPPRAGKAHRRVARRRRVGDVVDDGGEQGADGRKVGAPARVSGRGWGGAIVVVFAAVGSSRPPCLRRPLDATGSPEILSTTSAPDARSTHSTRGDRSHQRRSPRRRGRGRPQRPAAPHRVRGSWRTSGRPGRRQRADVIVRIEDDPRATIISDPSGIAATCGLPSEARGHRARPAHRRDRTARAPGRRELGRARKRQIGSALAGIRPPQARRRAVTRPHPASVAVPSSSLSEHGEDVALGRQSPPGFNRPRPPYSFRARPAPAPAGGLRAGQAREAVRCRDGSLGIHLSGWHRLPLPRSRNRSGRSRARDDAQGGRTPPRRSHGLDDAIFFRSFGFSARPAGLLRRARGLESPEAKTEVTEAPGPRARGRGAAVGPSKTAAGCSMNAIARGVDGRRHGASPSTGFREIDLRGRGPFSAVNAAPESRVTARPPPCQGRDGVIRPALRVEQLTGKSFSARPGVGAERA
jgi:hypothetical protein